jgi:glycosyltransferase involved in cell wall biosynthesis
LIQASNFAVKPLISIIIPAFNEEDTIVGALEGLADQTLSKDQFEVIVVDNGSTDATAEVAARFSSSIDLKIVKTPRTVVSTARNYGVASAQGEVLAFLDAETALRLRKPMIVWGAHYAIPANSTWVGRVWTKYQNTAKSGYISFIPAGSLFISKEDFARIGGFNETIRTSEDVELCVRARSFGMRVEAYPELAVLHYGTPRGLMHFYKQNRWHGLDVVPNFLRNLPSLENLPVVGLSFYTLLLVWALLVALVTLHWKLSAVLLILLLLPSFLISVKKTFPRGVLDLPKLTVLYVTYFLSRAASITKNLIAAIKSLVVFA